MYAIVETRPQEGDPVGQVTEVSVAPQPIDRFRPVIGDDAFDQAMKVARAAAERLSGRVIWNVNSTALGGGVAEMLRSLLAYARGAGIDTRWVVISGTSEFFYITKRIHHALHGSKGDGRPLDEHAREVYESVLKENAEELEALIRPRDIVILHDPQTIGLAPALARHGATVIWRCHIGTERGNGEVAAGWAFLEPYFDDIAASIFSRAEYVPERLNRGRETIIQPSIDVFSPKNQDMDDDTVRAILAHVGIVEGPIPDTAPVFTRMDGSPGRVDRHADIVRSGRAPTWDTPLVVQISRWDTLKDHAGVMQAFCDMVCSGVVAPGAHLVLAGPNVHAVADDPEGAKVLDDLTAAWRQLPHVGRAYIDLISLPMADVEENAAIVNALQRHAAIIVQKSLFEGFGLTVTEAMWKARPIVASRVGGIQDQIEHGVHGLLIDDPADLKEFEAALCRLMDDPDYARQLGQNARQRVTEKYLGIRHLLEYEQLLARLDAEAETASARSR